MFGFRFLQRPPKEQAISVDPVMDLWRPKNGTPAVLLRWLMSEWCNYRCPYCPQTHDRRAPKGDGMTAHCFDNFNAKQWIEAFDRHFQGHRLSLVLTGGETMLDRKNMTILINHLTASPLTASIRIDTNAWWKPTQFAELDPSKLILMCTFHPSQADEDEFIERLKSYQTFGYTIGMVNYVLDDHNRAQFERRKHVFAELGLVLHPNPLWQKNGQYSETDLRDLRDLLPELDFRFRTGDENPHMQPCRFPALAFEMDCRGAIHAGCLDGQIGSFFDEALPIAPAEAIECPHHSCVCLDKYSFLSSSDRNTTLNPLKRYCEIISSRQFTQN